MRLGWIDFSKSERSKVMSVLDLLSQPGTLDELGIAPVRDGFADLFFPGTSTIQTRAKYFMIIPYILRDLELSDETNPHRLARDLSAKEKDCAARLISKGEDPDGIIGRRSLSQGGWVKRPPSSIYWAGLRNYGIFMGNLSLAEYLWHICEQKNQRKTLQKLGNRMGNRNDREENPDKEQDDWDAGGLYQTRFWSVPTYEEDWAEHLELRLTADEGAYLKRQIITSHPESMMAFILKNQRRDILHCGSFENMGSLIQQFPERIQEDYQLARSFAEFLYVLRILYNVILSEGKNETANRLWLQKSSDLNAIAGIDIDAIIERLSLFRQAYLCRFLRNAKDLMMRNDTEGLKEEIKRREQELKGARAKTTHPGEFGENEWYGGGILDYRFGNGSRIMNDIFESEDQHV